MNKISQRNHIRNISLLYADLTAVIFRQSIFRRATVFTSLVMMSTAASPQITPDTLPDNSHVKDNSGNWECDDGYKRFANSCVSSAIPANAYSTGTPYGRGWECNRGYRLDNENCIAVQVPENA